MSQTTTVFDAAAVLDTLIKSNKIKIKIGTKHINMVLPSYKCKKNCFKNIMLKTIVTMKIQKLLMEAVAFKIM